jgi:hypothetical protein
LVELGNFSAGLTKIGDRSSAGCHCGEEVVWAFGVSTNNLNSKMKKALILARFVVVDGLPVREKFNPGVLVKF